MSAWTTLNLILAGAQQNGGGSPQQAPGLIDMLKSFAPFLIIIVVFMWLMSRSQKKKEQKREEMLSNIKAKDRVVTVGGIRGKVVSVQDDTFVLRVDDEKDVKITISRNGISGKVGDEEEQS
jgi:preprotein translocase subunit YajC